MDDNNPLEVDGIRLSVPVSQKDGKGAGFEAAATPAAAAETAGNDAESAESAGDDGLDIRLRPPIAEAETAAAAPVGGLPEESMPPPSVPGIVPVMVPDASRPDIPAVSPALPKKPTIPPPRRVTAAVPEKVKSGKRRSKGCLICFILLILIIGGAVFVWWQYRPMVWEKIAYLKSLAGLSEDETAAAGEASVEDGTPSVNTPAVETPPAETPAVETPVAETPAVETPPAETPAAETPVVETPPAETPAAETPIVETPPAETPAAETPVADTPAAGKSRLLEAARTGNKNEVLRLLANGALISETDTQGNNILHCAVTSGNVALVVAILQRWTNGINSRNRDGNTPLHLAAAGNHQRIVRILLGKRAAVLTNNDGKTPAQMTDDVAIRRIFRSRR